MGNPLGELMKIEPLSYLLFISVLSSLEHHDYESVIATQQLFILLKIFAFLKILTSINLNPTANTPT